MNNSVKCQITNVGTINIPIYMSLNKFGLFNLNEWDGNSVKINEDGDYILTPQVGAGTKNEDNTFTGIVIGEVKSANSNEPYKGIFGYNGGQRSVFIDAEDGSAILGTKAGGQIIIDAAEGGLLYSNSYWKSYDNKGKPNTSAGKANAGMLIDLKTPKIEFGNGNFKVNSDGKLTATGVNISGEITATTGNIGNWTIDEGSIKNGTTTIGSDGTIRGSGGGGSWTLSNNGQATFTGVNITGGSLNIGGNFSVSSNGTLFARNANITGDIYANGIDVGSSSSQRFVVDSSGRIGAGGSYGGVTGTFRGWTGQAIYVRNVTSVVGVINLDLRKLLFFNGICVADVDTNWIFGESGGPIEW